MQFKHICISAAYFGPEGYLYCYYRKNQRKMILFEYILETIIKKSLSSLQTLEIDIKFETFGWSGNQRKPSNVLLYILNKFDILPIRKLIYSRDYFKPTVSFTFSNPHI